MSIIGPRPLLREELYQHRQSGDSSLLRAIELRQSLKPGMTGLSQTSIAVRTRRGSAYWAMLEQDMWYVMNRTIRLDILVLMFTPLYLLSAGRILFPLWLTTFKAGLCPTQAQSPLRNVVRH